ncbi:Ig-like domain-containing protein [Bacillus safensis]|uniref:Ig-like domain-containing protein n=1 Tax=Bacillus safensis TaxID=561879 RepID=UPI0032502B94
MNILKRILGSFVFIFIFSFSFVLFASAEEVNMSSGVSIYGELKSKSSMNRYNFTTNADGEVYIRLDKASASFSITLYDSKGNKIDSNESSFPGEALVIDNKLKKGNYYIEVMPSEWEGVTKGTYQLKATYPGAFKRNLTTFEPNDTFETSMKVSNGTYYKSTIDSEIDKDVYQFSSNKDGELYLTLDQETSELEVTVYNENRNEIVSDYTWNAGENIVIHENIKKGTYYVKIKPYTSNWEGISNAKYRLKVTYPGSFKRDLNTYEPNDTFETASPLISNQYYKSKHESDLDRDVYQFSTVKDGKVKINLDKITEGASIALYDKNGNEITREYLPDIFGTSPVIDLNLKKGKYYIVVEPRHWDGVSSQTYRLKASYPDKTPSINTVTDQSTNIVGNAETNAKVFAYIGQKKLGSTNAKKGKYSIKIPKQKAGTLITVYLVDSNGARSGSKTIKVLDRTPPAIPSVNKITKNTTVITGKGEKYATVYVYHKNKKLGTAKLNKNGQFKVKIKKQKKNALITVYLKDAAGNKSKSKVVKVY